MKIQVENWRGDPILISLEEACTPVAQSDHYGRLENVDAKADKNAEVLGKLIAHLVRCGAVSLDEAKDIIGNDGPWTPVED